MRKEKKNSINTGFSKCFYFSRKRGWAVQAQFKMAKNTCEDCEVQQAAEVFNYLVNNLAENIEISLEKIQQDSWSKSLKHLLLFTIKEIETYRLKSGKNRHAIIKTRDRGRKFMEERYITSGDVFTKWNANTITIKAKCKASMKKETRNMNVVINKKSANVIKGHCSCPAGNSGYCNHVMALLFEIADYSLHKLKTVPEEVACTSKKRQWGVPTDKQKYPLPIMSTKVEGDKKKGVSSTLYDPRLYENKSEEIVNKKINNLQEVLRSKDPRIGFAHIINSSNTLNSTKYGDFIVGSPLSYQLAVFEAGFEVISNSLFQQLNVTVKNELMDFNLPVSQIHETHESFPTNWGILSYIEMMLFDSIFPETLENSQHLERNTVGQGKNKLWLEERSKRITSSQAHKIHI